MSGHGKRTNKLVEKACYLTNQAEGSVYITMCPEGDPRERGRGEGLHTCKDWTKVKIRSERTGANKKNVEGGEREEITLAK